MSQTRTPGLTCQSPTERARVCRLAAGAGLGELYSDRADCGRAAWLILVRIWKRTCQAEQLCYLGYSPTSPALRQDLRRTLHEHVGEEDPSYQNNSSVPGARAHTPAGSMGRESLSNPLFPGVTCPPQRPTPRGHLSTPMPYPHSPGHRVTSLSLFLLESSKGLVLRVSHFDLIPNQARELAA